MNSLLTSFSLTVQVSQIFNLLLIIIYSLSTRNILT